MEATEQEYAQDLRDAGADTVLCLPFAQALEQVPGGAETYFVVVTRAHAFDVACLEQILQKPAAYVGMMGSRGRATLVRRQLLEAGADAARVEAVQAPIGLAIGAKTAEEIALSILAQIVEVKNAKLSRPHIDHRHSRGKRKRQHTSAGRKGDCPGSQIHRNDHDRQNEKLFRRA